MKTTEETLKSREEEATFIVFAVNSKTNRRIMLDGVLNKNDIAEIVANPKYKDLTIQGLPTNRTLDQEQMITFKK